VDTPEQALREAHAAEVEGNLNLAESILRSACKRWRREPEFKMRHGRILRSLGNDRKALKVFRAVLKAHPHRADAAVAAAETATSLNKSRLAESLWGRALSVGAPTDVATVGLCRTIWIRGRKQEAWDRARGAFVQGGNSSRLLYDFLTECSPIIGTNVPELDLLETGELNDELTTPDSRRELTLSPATFSADSLESMAGITAAELAASHNDEISTLLGDEVEQPQVDMSAIGQAQATEETRTDVEIPDDLLDFD
jgi:tetratricopeptide (TPR) repeat protein